MACLSSVLAGRQGKDSEAEPLHQRALQLREALLGSRHPDVATSLEFLARMALKKGMYCSVVWRIFLLLALISGEGGGAFGSRRLNY